MILPYDFSFLPPGVAEDDGLGNGQGFVQITERVQLPFLSSNAECHEKVNDNNIRSTLTNWNACSLRFGALPPSRPRCRTA